MIATTLFGGLGNQMFVYAMVRALSLRNDTEMAFNLNNGFATDYQFHRSLELNHFALSLPRNSLHTYDYGLAGRIVKNISRRVGFNIMKMSSRYMIEEDEMRFQKEIAFCAEKNLYLEGYWQSPLYFEDYADVIRKDFEIKTQIPVEVEDEMQSYKAENRPLVMVGVRRYQECKQISYLTEHVCTQNYYLESMRYMAEQIADPLFIIFSQDCQWVKDNLTGLYDVRIAKAKDGELSAISDLYIMSRCNHAIISNSSFYWWGAWLQKPEGGKMVIAPDNFINKNCCCTNWIVKHV